MKEYEVIIQFESETVDYKYLQFIDDEILDVLLPIMYPMVIWSEVTEL